jgi:alpha-D-ribose 1-methylphosphonate 5-triphosphate synthase subunit PhnL
MLNVNAIIRPAGENVFVSVIVEIGNAHTPLVTAANRTVINITERTIGTLIQNVKHLTFVKHYDVIKPITVHISEPDTTSTVIF